MNRRKRFIRVLLLSMIVLLSVLLLAEVSPAAEKFPSREIIIVVTSQAGGSSDLAVRVLAEQLKKELGVPVVVENRTDGGGSKGVVDVYNAKPDGYLLLANLFPKNAQIEIAYNPPYKILDLTYVAAFYRDEMFLVVRKDSPYKTLKDLREASQKKSLNCSIIGQGSLTHLNAMLLKRKMGVDLEVVPYKGVAPAVTALLGGHVDLTFSTRMTTLQYKGKVHPVAVFFEERSDIFPDVPSIKELGYDIPFGYSILGISGSPGLSEEIRKILSDASVKAIKNPEFISKLDQMGAKAIYMTGPQFHRVAETFYKSLGEYKDIFAEK